MGITDELAKIVGAKRVSTSKEVCLSYGFSPALGKDWTTIPDMVVLAETTEQVSQIVKAANKHNVPVTPKGAAGWAGHGGPLKGGILLDLSPMDKILQIDSNNMKAIAEAGCSFFKLSQELFKNNMMLPTAEYGCGPNVAASAITPVNAFGKTRYGRNIDLVEGFEVVLPTGEIVDVGSMAYADTDFGPFYRYITGPDLVGLFTQSNGAFGIVTKVAYSCLRKPAHWAFHTYYWRLDQIKEVTKVMQEAVAVEMFDVHINDRWKYAAGDEKAAQYDQPRMLPEDCYFIVYFIVNGENKKELSGKEQTIEEICKRNKGKYLPNIGKEFFTQWPTFFSPASHPILIDMHEMMRELSGGSYVYIYDSPNYPISAFPQVYTKLMELGKKYKIWGFPRMTIYDGFPMKSQTMCSQTWAFIDDNDQYWKEQIFKCRDEFRSWFGKKGGTFQAQLNPAIPEYSWTNQQSAFDLLTLIKKALDPNGILSPMTFDTHDEANSWPKK